MAPVATARGSDMLCTKSHSATKSKLGLDIHSWKLLAAQSRLFVQSSSDTVKHFLCKAVQAGPLPEPRAILKAVAPP